MQTLNNPKSDKMIEVYCECGSFLGYVIPGYTKAIQCYCGAVLSIAKPNPSMYATSLVA